MFSYEQFKRMKKSAIIINTARGAVIKSNDLKRALIEGELAGAGLDVFETEPPTSAADIMLTMQENVITTPHFAWYREEGNWDIRCSIMDDVRSFLKGNPTKSVVNPDVLNSSQLKFQFQRAGLI